MLESRCDKVNEPVNASKGSNNKVWFSLFLSFSFLISSSNSLLVSIPDKDSGAKHCFHNLDLCKVVQLLLLILAEQI